MEKITLELLKSLKAFYRIKYRIPGCSHSDCLICKENKKIFEAARKIIERAEKERENHGKGSNG